MTKRLATAFLSILVAAVAMAADIHGAWTANAQDLGKVHLFMTMGSWHQFEQTFHQTDLGIDDSVLQAATATPVTLTLKRDAGTLVLEGTFRNGDGAGQFTFAANHGYFGTLRSMGIAFELPEDHSEADELFKFAVLDVSMDYIRSLRAAGVDVHDLREAMRLRAVNVTPKFVAELADAGYKNLSTRDLIRLAAAGVDARFIRDMSPYSGKQ